MYVTNQGRNIGSVIDTNTNTVITNIQVNVQPVGIAYDPVNERIYNM